MARCKACGKVSPANANACSCGQPVTVDGVARSGMAIVSFLALIGISLIGMGGNGDTPRTFSDYLRSSVGTIGLLAATAGLTYFFRREIATGLRALENSPTLQPWWNVQTKLPKGVCVIAGLAAPFAIAFILTDYLSTVLKGYGFLVLLTLVPINVVVANLFLGGPGVKQP